MMNKIKCFVMLLGIILPAALSLANSNLVTEKDGGSIIVINKSNPTGQDKSASISASIDGHTLVVVFTENLGSVDVAVSYAGGGTVDITKVITPSGYNIYIGATGSFVVRFTLSNGDEYTGEFEITE